jgi:transposase-like protein
MGNHPRKADGRRVFSAEFKRTTVQRILTGKTTTTELSRELGNALRVIWKWPMRTYGTPNTGLPEVFHA